MEIFSRLLHEEGKTQYVKEFAETDSSTWPAEWKTTFYKEYLRFPSITLPEITQPPQADLFTAIASRRSQREFSGEGLQLDQLSALLKYSCGEFNKTSEGTEGGYRAQPSGGARFPIEMYVLLFSSKEKELKPGVYHYNVKKHTLEWMWEGGDMFEDKSFLMKSGWTKKASALLVMTGVFWRTQNKYQARGYRMVGIETGAIMQNLYLVSGALGLKCVAFAGTNDDKIEQLLDLDTDVESLVTSVVIGT